MLAGCKPVPLGHSFPSWTPRVCGGVQGEAWRYGLSGSKARGCRLLAAAVRSLRCLCIPCQESSLSEAKSSFQAFVHPWGVDATESM